jgi:holliday junction DNA helicase RuvA
MITFVRGTLVSATPLQAVVDCGGIGYEIHIPVTTAERLPATGQTVRLQTHVVYREDAQTLYGFATAEERDFFRLLIEKVSGVGPKVALSIMSKLSLPMLRGAIAGGDINLLSKCPGIGKKTAERLIIELKDVVGLGSASSATILGPGAIPAPSGPESKIQDAVLALVTLGYKAPDADKAVRKAFGALGPEVSAEALIKASLK